jgi:hypothetical protein
VLVKAERREVSRDFPGQQLDSVALQVDDLRSHCNMTSFAFGMKRK